MVRIVLTGIRWVYRFLLCAGVVALALFAWHYFEATYYQEQYERAFEQLEAEGPHPATRDRGGESSTANRPEDEVSELSHLVGRLEIGRIDLDVMVLNGADTASLRRGAGWIRRTATPGAPGNMGIAGHRDTHFRPLEQVRKGDRIDLTTVGGRRFQYQVAWIAVVDPSQLEVIGPTEAPALTLITCYPFDYIGRAPRRFVVRAVRVPG
jgi:sortase A